MVSSAPSGVPSQQLVGAVVDTIDQIETPGIWKSKETKSIFVVSSSPQVVPLSALIRSLLGPFELASGEVDASEADLLEMANADGYKRVFLRRPTSDGTWLNQYGEIVSVDFSRVRRSPNAILGASPQIKILSRLVQPAFLRLHAEAVPDDREKGEVHLRLVTDIATRINLGSVLNF